MGIRCPQCGRELSADAKFCLDCGARILPAKTICPCCGKEIPRGRLCLHCGYMLTEPCPHCGAELLGKENFCPECGRKIKGDDTVETEANT